MLMNINKTNKKHINQICMKMIMIILILIRTNKKNHNIGNPNITLMNIARIIHTIIIKFQNLILIIIQNRLK